MLSPQRRNNIEDWLVVSGVMCEQLDAVSSLVLGPVEILGGCVLQISLSSSLHSASDELYSSSDVIGLIGIV